MNENIREFLDRIQALEQSIEMEAKIRRQQWQADFEERKIRFEKEVFDCTHLAALDAQTHPVV